MLYGAETQAAILQDVQKEQKSVTKELMQQLLKNELIPASNKSSASFCSESQEFRIFPKEENSTASPEHEVYIETSLQKVNT